MIAAGRPFPFQGPLFPVSPASWRCKKEKVRRGGGIWRLQPGIGGGLTAAGVGWERSTAAGVTGVERLTAAGIGCECPQDCSRKWCAN